MNTAAAEALGKIAPYFDIWEAKALVRRDDDATPFGWTRTMEALNVFEPQDYFWDDYGRVRYVRRKALMAWRSKAAETAPR